MKLLRFAAIDVGTNAIRLLFKNVIEDGDSYEIKKSSLIRVPIRLGADVFSETEISEDKIQKLIKTMKAFKHLINVYECVKYQANATSAMREATNGTQVVSRVKEKSGVDLQIISGKEEAETIFLNQIGKNSNKSTLYVDVGGGSTEFTLFQNNKVEDYKSFKIGTIRLLHDKVQIDEMQKLRKWLKEIASKKDNIELIGSGGNINKYFKLSGKKEGKPLSFYHLMEIYEDIKFLSIDNRIKQLGLNPDRADVIIPAGKLFLDIMKELNIRTISVPKIGLADGIIVKMYQDYKNYR